jgi:hypothetical protein
LSGGTAARRRCCRADLIELPRRRELGPEAVSRDLLGLAALGELRGDGQRWDGILSVTVETVLSARSLMTATAVRCTDAMSCRASNFALARAERTVRL